MMTDNINQQPDRAREFVRKSFEIKPPRNRTKALVTRSVRNGCDVVIKDFSRCSALIKMAYGRPTLRREERAYRALQGIVGIPEAFGLEDKDRLVIKYIHGRLLSSFKRGQVAADVFDRIDAIVKGAHARGVAFGDLHISNIIITETADVFLIDFSNAVFARASQRPGPLVRLVMELDRHAVRRMRARYLRQPEPVPVGIFGVLYRFGRRAKSARRKIKNFLKAGG